MLNLEVVGKNKMKMEIDDIEDRWADT